ncbi:hypothetical protein VK792_11210 [Mesobacterium sp. TK19101]|uniref:Integral membrane protein n=1 Tax=Mesobacterium hydrothermale TaxID=3111907 RepID=A0ABU6HHB9_9RHOB|nr:hypothetical protein [Mesobacterium sp. TK19101]MEC3861855.1 hypothetical protein [Mesobacterium sp. TK19101]
MAFKTPKSQVLTKFVLLLGLLAANFLYLSLKFDLATGGIASALTWSFFVLCTPIADAGFLLDFPLRLIFGIRMVLSELMVWALAIGTNVATLLLAQQYYDTTILTRILHQILITPWPYWSVIVLSATGTFLSIRFGDELMDILNHRDRSFFQAHHFKYELILFAFFLMVLFGYFELIRELGLEQIL